MWKIFLYPAIIYVPMVGLIFSILTYLISSLSKMTQPFLKIVSIKRIRYNKNGYYFHFYCYYANHTTQSHVISNEGKLVINNLHLSCKMVFIDKKDKFKDQSTPLLVNPGESVKFLLVSQTINPKLIRKNKKRCFAKIIIYKSGMFKTKHVKSLKRNFY